VGANNTDERLKLREYARRCSISHTAVQDAIKAGKFPDGWDAVNERFIVSVADEEWGTASMAMRGVKPVEYRTEKQIEIAKRNERKVADAVNKLSEPFKENVTPEEKKVIEKAELEASTDTGNAGMWDGKGDIPDNVKFPEALRIERIEMARTKKLQREELEGLLVRKSEVDKQLLIAGIEIRNLIQRFPQAIVDAVLGAKNRHEALKEMEDGTIELLSKIGVAIATAIK
jgi:hypothetical protein